jgi:DNA-binding CsgD family transcriptional regulator
MNKKLTATESRVLQLIAEQKKSKEIAEILFVSEKTIRNHRYNIKKKLDLPKENNSLLKWAILNIKI